MKLTITIARYLLGFMFTVFGLNGFLHFIPQPPPASPMAQQFFTVMVASHFFVVVFLVQVIGGVLLLLNRFVPLGLVLLAPVLVNILNYHSLMDPAGLPAGLVAAVLWCIVFYGVRRAFVGILRPAPIPAEI